MRQSVPVNVDAAIRKALEKLPADRFTRAQDFARALADPTFRHGVEAATTTTASAGPWKWVAAGMTAVAGIASVFAFASVIGPESGRRIERFAVPFQEGQEPTYMGRVGFDLSPDGSMLVYRHNQAGGQVLMVRPMGRPHGHPHT